LVTESVRAALRPRFLASQRLVSQPDPIGTLRREEAILSETHAAAAAAWLIPGGKSPRGPLGVSGGTGGIWGGIIFFPNIDRKLCLA
jgi:hypothetical protein